MTSNEDYYNERYAQIHDDYLSAEDWKNRQNANSTAMKAHAATMLQNILQNTSRQKRQSRYDENGYALPEYDF